MSSGSSVTSENADWNCKDSDCRHLNQGHRNNCSKCQRERSKERTSSGGSNKRKLGTEIGKAAAEKSRGLFSAEDWQCSKCANVNWARRSTCNLCNAPKFCDVEKRTGYGGGYNDRGVVEYKDRLDSDSEYDEFGRLKKRKKPNSIEDRLERQVKSKDDEDDEDEEEEDDDGSDNDLSKYDLWGDEDIATNAVPDAKTADSKTKPVEGNNRSKAATPKNERSRSPTSSHSGSKSRSSSRSSSTSTSSSSSSSSTSSSSSKRSSKRDSDHKQRDCRSRSPRNKSVHSRIRSRSSEGDKEHRHGRRDSSKR